MKPPGNRNPVSEVTLPDCEIHNPQSSLKKINFLQTSTSWFILIISIGISGPVFYDTIFLLGLCDFPTIFLVAPYFRRWNSSYRFYCCLFQFCMHI